MRSILWFVFVGLVPLAAQEALPQRIERLVRKLASEDWTQRQTAEKELKNLLKHMRWSKQFPQLIERLRAHLKTCRDVQVRHVLCSLCGPPHLPAPVSLLRHFPNAARLLASADPNDHEKLAYWIGEWRLVRCVGLLEALMKSEVEDVRREAVKALAAMRTEAATHALIAALNDPRSDAQEIAIEALMKRRAKEAIPALWRLLEGDGFVESKEKALYALWDLQPEKRKELLILALKRDYSLPCEPEEAAAILRDRKHLPFLLAALKSGGFHAEMDAAEILAELGAEEAVEPIYRLIRQKEKFSCDCPRVALATCLMKIGTKRACTALLQLLKKPDIICHDYRIEIARFLCPKHKKWMLKGLLQMLKSDNPEWRYYAVIALASINATEAIPQIAKLLDDPDIRVRSEAVGALGWLKAKQFVGRLLKMLKTDPDLESSLIYALGLIGDVRAVKPLAERLLAYTERAKKHPTGGGYEEEKKDKTRLKRRALAKALGWLGTKVAVEALIKVVNDDPNRHVRGEAVEALGKLRAKEAVPHIIPVLTDVFSRDEAERALLNIDRKVVVKALIDALEADDEDIRIAAAEMLAKMNAKSAAEPLLKRLLKAKSLSPEQAHLSAALGQLATPQILPRIIALLQHEDCSFHYAALTALAKTDPTPVLPHILTFLKRSDTDDSERLRAAPVLAKIKNKKAQNALIEMLQNTDDINLKYAVIDALARQGLDGAESALVGVLSEREKGLRIAAIEALGKLRAEGAVVHLVRCLTAEDKEVVFAAADALEAITRQPFGADYDAWLNWLKKKRRKNTKKNR